MHDLQQGHGRNHHCSFNPAYQSNGSYSLSKTTSDFDFWEEQRPKHYEHYDDLASCEMEFRTLTQIEDDYRASSPLFWMRRRSRNLQCEASPLLPYNHYYSYPSPKSRSQAIADGRRELMEMVQNMPESSYELSLKDIVDDQQSIQGVQQDVGIEEKNLNFKTEVKINQEKKISKRGPISRSESMDSGAFLLKMFFPTSLSLKKKSITGKSSKVSPRPSFKGSEKPLDKKWWKMRFLITGENKNSSSSINQSINSSKSRHAESNFTPACWSFHSKNCKSRRQRGCLF